MATENGGIETKTPYGVLLEMERRCLEVGAELPKIEDLKALWTGIGFRIGDLKMISPLGQIQEVLSNPEMTLVPGAKDWVRGITNNRGNLIPIIDLAKYLEMGKVSDTRRNRVLVIRFGLLNSGLLVDEVKGQRHFEYEQEVPIEQQMLYGKLTEFVESAFSREGDIWMLFNMRRLVEAPTFLHAAQ